VPGSSKRIFIYDSRYHEEEFDGGTQNSLNPVLNYSCCRPLITLFLPRNNYKK